MATQSIVQSAPELFPDEAVAVKIFLDSGEILQWPISENEAVQFEVPLALFRVLTAEVTVEEIVPPKIPGDGPPKRKKVKKRAVVRTFEGVSWAKVKRWEYVFETKKDEDAVEQPEAVH